MQFNWGRVKFSKWNYSIAIEFWLQYSVTVLECKAFRTTEANYAGERDRNKEKDELTGSFWPSNWEWENWALRVKVAGVLKAKINMADKLFRLHNAFTVCIFVWRTDSLLLEVNNSFLA